MQDKFYADHRDLVKWSVLIRLAEQYKLARIIQIAYLRPSVFHNIDIAGQQMDIPPEVRKHFRDMRNVTAMGNAVSVSVFDLAFNHRAIYKQAVRQYLTRFAKELRLVFLDPDTGLEPGRSPSLNHVLDSEAYEIWTQLNSNEIFALYQHQTNKAGKPWIDPKRTQLEKAIQAPPGTVSVAQSPRIANDVVILFAVKPANG